jgi:hypothetical protein
MRGALPLAILLLAAACGGGGTTDGAAILARAQEGMRHLDSMPVHLKVTAQTPVPVERSLDITADRLPNLDLTRWAKRPERIACADGLECARADVDVEAALRELGPLLPSLPVEPKDIRNAQIDVAVDKSGRTRYLHLHGDVHVTLLGDVPFEANLDVPPS